MASNQCHAAMHSITSDNVRCYSLITRHLHAKLFARKSELVKSVRIIHLVDVMDRNLQVGLYANHHQFSQFLYDSSQRQLSLQTTVIAVQLVAHSNAVRVFVQFGEPFESVDRRRSTAFSIYLEAL